MIFRKKDLGKVDGGRINGNADEMGIHYGGSASPLSSGTFCPLSDLSLIFPIFSDSFSSLL